MWRDPKLSHAVLAAMFAAVFLGYASYGYAFYDGSVGVSIAVLIALLLGIVMFATALSYYVDWVWFVYIRYHKLRREADAVTPRLEELRAAARLTPEQAKLVSPANTGGVEVGISAGDVGPRYYLITRSGAVPVEWIADYLTDCGVVSLRPVRTYADGTPGRMYAQAFTDWCVEVGLAAPAVGPNAAMWINEHARSRVKQMIGFAEDDDE